MVVYLTNTRLAATVTSREGGVSWGGLEYLLNPCARLDTRLHPVLEPVVGSSLEYECSVTRVVAQSGLV